MAVKLTKPEMINQQVGWCGGCGHGIIQRLIAECCEELGIVEKTVQVVDIACAYWSIDTLNCDGIAGPHGRCAAVATGIKRVRPEANVYLFPAGKCSRREISGDSSGNHHSQPVYGGRIVRSGNQTKHDPAFNRN